VVAVAIVRRVSSAACPGLCARVREWLPELDRNRPVLLEGEARTARSRERFAHCACLIDGEPRRLLVAVPKFRLPSVAAMIRE